MLTNTYFWNDMVYFLLNFDLNKKVYIYTSILSHILCHWENGKSDTFNNSFVEKSTGSGILFLIVQALNLLSTTLKTPKF